MSSCFAALHQIKSIQRSVSQPVLLSLISSLVLVHLDYESIVLTGIPRQLMDCLVSAQQSCIKYSTSKYQYQYQLSKHQYKYQY